MNFWDARSYVHQIYPHHVGHWLGIEVHDCSAISTSHKLHNNIAFTVEPGIYLSTEENWINCVPEKYSICF